MFKESLKLTDFIFIFAFYCTVSIMSTLNGFFIENFTIFVAYAWRINLPGDALKYYKQLLLISIAVLVLPQEPNYSLKV